MNQSPKVSEPVKEKSVVYRSLLWASTAVIFLALGVTISIWWMLDTEIFGSHEVIFWKVVFILGITLSVWGQYATTAYFIINKMPDTVNFTAELKYLSHIVQFLMVLPAGFAIIAVIAKENPLAHLSAVIVYLMMVVVADWIVWKKAVPIEEDAENEFKVRCKQLLFYIDLPAALFVLIWAIIVWLYLANLRYASLPVLESISSEMLGRGIEGIGEFMIALKKQTHSLSEPLLAGVIGYQMMISSYLLVFHLKEWDNSSFKHTQKTPLGKAQSVPTPRAKKQQSNKPVG